MPITKKKGAIFPIYADSPAQSTRSAAISGSILTTSTSHQIGASPTKKLSLSSGTTKPRKALATVQARSIGVPSDPSLAEKSEKGKGKAKASIGVFQDETATGNENTSGSAGKTTTTVSVNPKSTVTVTSGTTVKRVSSTSRKVITSKRQFEIFRAPSPPAIPSVHSTVARDTTTIPITQPTRISEAHSPAKKTRSTPRRSNPAPSTEDKENAVPSLSSDSPASRTRSKVRTNIVELSPLQPLRLASASERKQLDSLVGDGRGTLTFKKGRDVSKLMKGSKGLSAVAPLGMAVLGDVSEAYGAEGSEPEGFKTQRR